MRFTECINSEPFKYKLPTTTPPTTTPFRSISCVDLDPMTAKQCKCANKAGFNYKTGPFPSPGSPQYNSMVQCMNATDPPTTTPLRPANISGFNMNSNSGSSMRGGQTTKDPFYLGKGPCFTDYIIGSEDHRKCMGYCNSNFSNDISALNKCAGQPPKVVSVK
jgi:hypothetical protein